MIRVQGFEVGCFGTNMYVVSDEKNCLLIDPACQTLQEQQQLIQYLEKLNDLKLTAIIATHGHLDHLWGAAWACETFRLPVLMHEKDIPMAQAMQQQYDLFGIRATAQAFPIEPLTKTTYDEWHQMHILHTPGHTPGSICLHWPDENILLSGDTLFFCGYGRTDLPGGNTAQLLDSLNQIFALPHETRVYCGHGQETTIGAENSRFSSFAY